MVKGWRKEGTKMSNPKKWLSPPPTKCDLCGDPLVSNMFIDGRIDGCRSWAIMCPLCHQESGVGLGTGLGQAYALRNGEYIKIGG